MKATVRYHDLTADPDDLPSKPRRWRHVRTRGGDLIARLATCGALSVRVWVSLEGVPLSDADVLGWWSLPKLEEER